MSTNSSGTTVSQFKNGVTKYVNRQGYSISYTSLMSSGKINYESAKSTVQSNKAVALFLATLISKSDGFDVLDYEYSTTYHVAEDLLKETGLSFLKPTDFVLLKRQEFLPL